MVLVGSVMTASRADASGSELTATINGLKSQNGQLCLSLFSQASGFPSRGDRAIASQCIRVSDASPGITFKDLHPGSYAVAVFHDANADGKLNKGFLGIPREGFGFSRNPRIGTSAPRFKDAVFLVLSPDTEIEIEMKYF